MSPASPMSGAGTQAVLDRYLRQHDVTCLADDVVFTIMGTGQTFAGRAGGQQMLDYFYHTAFEATAEPTNLVFGPGQAVVEADFVGTHRAEFAGVAVTQRPVRVPMCLVYDVDHDHITRGRVYFETAAFLQQTGAAATP